MPAFRDDSYQYGTSYHDYSYISRTRGTVLSVRRCGRDAAIPQQSLYGRRQIGSLVPRECVGYGTRTSKVYHKGFPGEASEY